MAETHVSSGCPAHSITIGSFWLSLPSHSRRETQPSITEILKAQRCIRRRSNASSSPANHAGHQNVSQQKASQSAHRIETRQCLLLTRKGHSHRGSDHSSVAAVPGLAGAFSTVAHAGGKSLSVSPLADGDGEASGIFKPRIGLRPANVTIHCRNGGPDLRGRWGRVRSGPRSLWGRERPRFLHPIIILNK